MIAPVLSLQAPPAQHDAAAALAVIAAARAKLLALTLQAGQVLEAKVLGPAPGGMTRLALGGQTLTLALPTPLPIGTMMQAQLRLDPESRQPQLVLRPAAGATPQSAPALQPTAPSAPLPGSASGLPMPLAARSSAAPTSSPTTIVVPLPASAPAPGAPSAPPAPPPSGVSPAAPNPAGPPSAAALLAGTPATLAATASAPAFAHAPVTLTAATPSAPMIAAPPPPAGASGPPMMSAPVPSASPAALFAPPGPALVPMPVTPISAAPSAPLGPSGTVSPTATPAAALPATPATASPATALMGSPHRSLLSPPPAPSTPPPLAGSAAGITLGRAAQAAARQDSIAPLLQNLAALHGRMASFPRPVAEAALRLLAGRLAVGKVAPDPLQLKQAVLKSGVVMSNPSTTGTVASDIRSGLIQLRSALLGFLGAEIAPVAAVIRRLPPPTRDTQTRGFRAEPASLPETATPKEAGRTLLHQTDAALSRIRLLQLASLPQDAARAGAPPADWTLEVPMLLGNELAVAQLRIAGDGRNGAGKRGRAWRLQFSVNFSILGEVGAQVGFSENRTSIALWAEEADTAAALETMLPELGAALAARGLEVGSLRVGRRAPENRRQRAGQLLDGLR